MLLTEQSCARLRPGLIIMQIPRGYQKKDNNTFFASGNAPKWGFFPKDRTYRAFFVLLHKRNFFRMVPEGLNAFGSFVHAAESAS